MTPACRPVSRQAGWSRPRADDLVGGQVQPVGEAEAALAGREKRDVADRLAAHALSRTPQFGMDARDAVGLAGGDVDDGDLVGKGLWPARLRSIAAAGQVKSAAFNTGCGERLCRPRRTGHPGAVDEHCGELTFALA